MPGEDTWEYSARAEVALTYPWGDAFDILEMQLFGERNWGHDRGRPLCRGRSPLGCYDMAGNVWEFVVTSSSASEASATLRGGSYKNNRSEIRAYLRLIRVPITHRPPDFGFRLAQLPA